MSLTYKQRCKQNKLNARKSTGPKTEAGKANSRKNAVKHGMTAKVVAMPQEDPVKIAAREMEWNDYYNPQSPGAQHLVHLCVTSTILTDRITLNHDAKIIKQIIKADECWLNEKSDLLEDLKTLLVDNPAMGYRMLRREAKGCDYLFQLAGALARAMYWYNPLAWWGFRQLKVELEQACALAPDSPEMHRKLASAYAKAGRHKDATREREIFAKLRDLQR